MAGTKNPVLKSFLLIYLAFILILTILSREAKDASTVKWVPLWSWYEIIAHHNKRLFEEVMLNILMLLPLGAILAWLNRRFEVKHAFRVGLCLSAGIEVAQLVFHLGLFEWDDMLHNTLGCVLGMLLARKIKKQ